MLLPNDGSKKSGSEMYASVIGSLLYIANTFRPDLSYSVSVLSQFTSNPTEEHWTGVKRILRYLNGTKECGLKFSRSEIEKHGDSLVGYTDADFAACFSRRSRTGFIFFIGGCVLSWSSKKQSVIALSTCEAEYYALTEGGKEAMHLNRLLWEFLNQKPLDDDQKLDPVRLFCDNQSTLFVAKNPAEHKMMKHVDLRYKWIQERVENEDFLVDYVSTKDQIADIFTKALPKETFQRLRVSCAVVKPNFTLAREC